MLELHPYLKRVYEDDIVDCMMCHTIAIKVSKRVFFGSSQEPITGDRLLI